MMPDVVINKSQGPFRSCGGQNSGIAQRSGDAQRSLMPNEA